MSVLILVLLFYCMTLLYFSYSTISYKVVFACIGDMFLSLSSIHHLEARVHREHDPLIQLIDDHTMCSSFVHKLEAHILRVHDPSIVWYGNRKFHICLYA
jgi:hypothetical protein